MREDPYVYSGTDVLINKEGIRDSDELEQFDRVVTANRMEHLPALIQQISHTYDVSAATISRLAGKQDP